jgi:outer membrane protein TolC
MLTVSQTELRSAKSMLSGVRAERKVGERSTFDEIRAIENVTSAETNLNAAKYELQAAEYTLAAETGVIDRLFTNPAGPAAVAAR